MNAITKLFNDAEKLRTEASRQMDLKELCDTMANEAGWHTEYCPNNRSKVKDRVKYDRSFDEHLICELLCRFKKKIIQQFIDRDAIYMESACSKIFDIVVRFMYTYNPSKCTHPAQLTNRMNLSIRQRAIECHFEEYTRYNYDGVNQDQHCIDDSIRLDDLSQRLEKADANYLHDRPDWRCAVNVSLQSTFKINNNGDERTLESVLEDTRYRQSLEYQEDLLSLEQTYASSEDQKLLLEILVSDGKKMSPKKLMQEFMKDTGKQEQEARDIVFSFYNTLKERLATV